MSDKSERVHALVNAGPWPGMSEAFDAHMGAECWVDPAYAPDAATWAAAWKKAKQAIPHNATEPMQKAMQSAVMLRKSMNDVWRAALSELGA
jgi:hypothetical protein